MDKTNVPDKSRLAVRYPVFLINLDRQPGRLRFMKTQLAAFGIDPVRVAATIGRDPAAQARSIVVFYPQQTPERSAASQATKGFGRGRLLDNSYDKISRYINALAKTI